MKRQSPKTQASRKEISPWPVLLIIASGFLLFFIDGIVLSSSQVLRSPYLDAVFGLFTNMAVVIALFLIIPAILLLLRHKVRETFFLCIAFLFSYIIGVAIKSILVRPRPLLSEFFFAEPFYYSFPSLHAMIVFALLPILIKNFPAIKRHLIGFALFIGFSRIYFSVHYLSDVFFGSLFGYAIGWYLSHEHIARKGALNHFLDSHRFEIRRKMVHMALGLILALLIQIGLLGAYSLGIITAIGFWLAYLEKKRRLPFLSTLLDIFERNALRKVFPGKGLLFFLLGSFLAVLLFPKDIALASIMVLAFGDAISHLFGVHFGKIIHPFSDKKFLEGAIAGFFAAAMGALLFVPAHEALLAAFAGMCVEALEVRVRRIQVDDNFLIPLAAGALILALRALSGYF